jgi:hypothetical protein
MRRGGYRGKADSERLAVTVKELITIELHEERRKQRKG